MPPELNFLADLNAHLRAELVALGFQQAADCKAVPDDRVGIWYFDARRRLIEPRPRVVKLLARFVQSFPEGHGHLVRELLRKVEAGEDLRDHQSKKLVKPRRRLFSRDDLFHDWGVTHLHLDPNTHMDTVLMCRVTPQIFYGIGFWPHRRWEDEEIITSMLESSWAEEFGFQELKGELASGPEKEERRRILRSKNMAMAFCHRGKTYLPLGGGLVSSGNNLKSVLGFSQLRYQVRDLQDRVAATLKELDVEAGRVVLEFNDLKPVSLREVATGHRVHL